MEMSYFKILFQVTNQKPHLIFSLQKIHILTIGSPLELSTINFPYKKTSKNHHFRELILRQIWEVLMLFRLSETFPSEAPLLATRDCDRWMMMDNLWTTYG